MAFRDSFRRPNGLTGWTLLLLRFVIDAIDWFSRRDYVADKYKQLFPNGFSFPDWVPEMIELIRSPLLTWPLVALALFLIQRGSRQATTLPKTVEATPAHRRFTLVPNGGKKASLTLRHYGPETKYSIEGRILRLIDGSPNPAPQWFHGELQPGANKKGDFGVVLGNDEWAHVIVADIGDNRNEWGGRTWLQVRRGKYGNSTEIPDSGAVLEYVVKAEPPTGKIAGQQFCVTRNGEFLIAEAVGAASAPDANLCPRSAQELMSLMASKTAIQKNAAIAPYAGMRLIIEGTVANVEPLLGDISVLLLLPGEDAGRLRFAHAFFDKRHEPILAALSKGDPMTAAGKIKSADHDSVTIESAELLSYGPRSA